MDNFEVNIKTIDENTILLTFTDHNFEKSKIIELPEMNIHHATYLMKVKTLLNQMIKNVMTQLINDQKEYKLRVKKEIELLSGELN